MDLFSNYKIEDRIFVNSAEILKSLSKQNFSEIFPLYYTLLSQWVTSRQQTQPLPKKLRSHKLTFQI